MARKKQKAAKGGAPISTHPAFPAIVALWFAALFGIGSMVLPDALVENAIATIGLHKILPAAAPPLGFTARAMIALVVAGIGLVAGLFLARKVAQSQAAPKERSRDLQLKEADRHPDAPAKRPISARAELGSEGLGPMEDPWKFEDEWASDDDDEYGDDDGYDYDEYDDDASYDGEDAGEDDAKAPRKPVPGALPGRRRALSVTDDSGPSDYLQKVPLPGESYDDPLELDILEEEEIEDMAAEDETAVEEFNQEFASLRNDAFVPAPAPQPRSSHSESGIIDPLADLTAPDEGDDEAVDHAEEEPAVAGDPAAVFAQAEAAQSAGSVDADSEQTNDFSTSPMQASPVQAPSQAPVQEQPMTEPNPDNFATPSAAPAATQAQSPASPASAALSDLGMAELVERFATAMQAKAARDESAPEASAEVGAPSHAFDGANPFADRAAEADLGQGGAAPSMASPLPFTSPLSAHDPEPIAAGSDPAPAPEPAQEPAPAPTAKMAPVDDAPAAPMVFRRSGASEEPVAPAQAEAVPSFAQERGIPSALQPLDLQDEDDEDDDTAHAPLSIDFAAQRPFADPVAKAPASPETNSPDAGPRDPLAGPAPSNLFAASEPEAEGAEEEGSEDAYSSLLSMKSKLSGQEFVRVDDEDDAADSLPEPVVVFPGQNENRQGESRPFSQEAQTPARMFDAPAEAAQGGNPVPQPTTPPSAPSDPTETERALREALEKLQRMSGAA